jgi:two-component system cell cycle sensor histidine kinase/response regulator CckA
MTMSRILVVDDDPSMLTLLKAGLSRWGFEVHTACQGVDAMMQFRAKADDITAIVTDIDMPRMGGLEFVRAVRDAGFHGRIIVMSGRMTPDELRAFQGYRVSGFFSKPFDISVLATMLSCAGIDTEDLPRKDVT